MGFRQFFPAGHFQERREPYRCLPGRRNSAKPISPVGVDERGTGSSCCHKCAGVTQRRHSETHPVRHECDRHPPWQLLHTMVDLPGRCGCMDLREAIRVQFPVGIVLVGRPSQPSTVAHQAPAWTIRGATQVQPLTRRIAFA